jgi:hypothetical protein
LAADLLTAFRDADVPDLPGIGELEEERLKALWILRVGQTGADTPVMTPAEISNVLRDVYGVSLSRQRIEGLLTGERGTVAKRKKDGKRAYQLMQIGIDEVERAKPAVLLIEPERALSSLRDTEALLRGLSGTLKICDPYVDGRTLDLLGECGGADAIELLTANINKATAFKRDAKAFGRQYGHTLDVRVAAAGILHDRYVIHDKGMLLFGTSLNGLGFKQSFVVSLGQDIRASVSKTFDSYWAKAAPL